MVLYARPAGAGEKFIGQTGQSHVTVQHTMTRAANTTLYTTLDAVANASGEAFEFANAARVSGGGGKIVGASLTLSVVATQPTQWNLFLFDTEPTAIADNIALTVPDAEMLTCCGSIVFTGANVEVTAVNSQINGGNVAGFAPVPFNLAAGSTSLWGLAQVVGAYTPASAEVLNWRLHIEQS